MRSLRAGLSLLLLVHAGGTPAAAQTEIDGQTASGAYYQAVVPEGWTPADGLAIWNHGYSLGPVAPLPDLGPLVDLQLSQGYAVAASSYSLPGWALFNTADDLSQMVDAFSAQFGSPGQIIVYGGSLGGVVSTQAIETPGLGNVVGGFLLCGAVAGSRVWDGAADLRLIYDYVCDGVPGASLPGGLDGLPLDFGSDPASLALAINVCTGISLPPALRSEGQTARLARILELTGIPESFLLTDMGFATVGITDLIQDPAKMDGGAALGNVGVAYPDPELDVGIERVPLGPSARLRFLDNFSPSGKVGETKIVSLHTDKDGLVIVENETEYASIVPPPNLTVAIVVEEEPSHCDFSDAEVVASWEVLRGWIAGAPQPTAGTIQTSCEALVAAGAYAGPCRIDPEFVLPDYDARVPPRPGDPPKGFQPEECVAGATTLCLSQERFRVRIDWREPGGGEGQGQAVPLTGDTGTFWFFDEANVEVIVKLVDACQLFDRFWVFAAGLTNVEVEIFVTDTETGAERTYTNPLGTPFLPIQDTSFFATCP